MERAGLFGGTFNPVHIGHLRVAQEVKEGYGLDRIYFIPSAIPPHKDTDGLADAADRYKMLSLAISGNPGFTVSDVEIKRKGRSYTIDTVEQFATLLPEGLECHLIVGADAFLDIHTWKSFQALFDRISFIVMSRPPQQEPCPVSHADEMDEYIRTHISSDYRYQAGASRFDHETKKSIHLFNVTPIGVTSTQIRSLARKNSSLQYLVPDAVSEYITSKGLYK